MLREEVNVLVVDDVNSTRVQIRELLKECGFRKISLASNGEEARILLEAEPFHLVLCDWYMEPGSGMDLLKFVRNHALLKALPFILVTGECQKEKVVEAIKSGIDDYIVKPMTMAQVQGKVFGLLLRKKVI